MSDYQVRARIPQETADKLFQIIKVLQEKTEAADVTISSVVRTSLENFIKEQKEEALKIEIPFKAVSNEGLEIIQDRLNALGEELLELDNCDVDTSMPFMKSTIKIMNERAKRKALAMKKK